jgi:hypothetical protein
VRTKDYSIVPLIDAKFYAVLRQGLPSFINIYYINIYIFKYKYIFYINLNVYL